MEFGMEATNELGNAYLAVTTDAAVNLPAPLYGGPLTRADGSTNTQRDQPCNPRHALISVEGGDIRYRLDGSEVVEPYGLLALDGSVIDWTDPLRNFSAFIANMSVIATRYNAGETSVLLNISWRT